jgi:Protein of unknown function (DUF2934)
MQAQMTEEQIRTLAFYLWEQDGSPDGRADEYWDKARQQLGLADSEPNARTEDATGFGDEPEAAPTRPMAD